MSIKKTFHITHKKNKEPFTMKNILSILISLFLFSSTAAISQGKFSGYIFGDYYYNVMRDATITSLKNVASPAGTTAYQAFQFRRIYFTYDNDISDQFASRLRLEADQTASNGVPASGDMLVGTTTSAGKVSMFVKDAYLMWKNVFSGSNLIFGVQPTPAFDVSETAWGYRSLEKTIMDLRGIVPSRDLGVSLKGKITDDGKINYWAMFANGSGNVVETDKYKRYYAHVQIKPTTNLQATLYVDYKDAADILNSYTKSNVGNSALTTALFVGYSEPFSYNIGVEGFLQTTANALKDTAAKSYSDMSGLGVSVFGSVYIIPELALVARYDNYNPSTDNNPKDPAHFGTGTASYLARNYIIAGLSWKVDKNVSIMPNVLYETYEAQKGGTTPDPSITTRLTVYYVFL
jgi:hypothetical protein